MPESSGRAERVLEHSRAMGRDFRELKGELSAAAHEIGQRVNVAEAAKAHPWRTVLAAVGVGYVMGGGLFTPLTRRLVGLGVRALLVPVVKGQLARSVG